jgi:hypothetical protein
MPGFRTAALRRAAIHIPKSSAPAVRFAAAELQHYLRRMTDVLVPVVEQAGFRDDHKLVLGAPDLQPATPSPLQSGSFRITPEAERVALEGGSARAVRDAVYALLVQCGCHWSLYGRRDETVPRLGASVDLMPVDGAPPFVACGYSTDIMTWHYTQPEYFNDRLDDDRDFIDWMGKSGANVFLFIRHPFDTQLTIPELLPELEKRGIGVEYGGHVMPLLLPRELYRAHPEYFPQARDGARTDNGNLCTSSADALAIASSNAVQYVHDYPEMSAVHIWGADLWHGGWCRCAACAPLSVQDQSLRVCNAVAHGLERAGVARPVCYLAYHDTIEPNLTLRPHHQVVAEFAPRERCYGHALDDPTCTTNRGYAAALERYVELFDGRIRIFEYYGDAILFFGCAVPLTQVIAADLAYFRRLGIPGITMLQFGLFSQWAYPLNFLAFAAAGAQPTAHISLADDYCRRFGVHARAVAAAFTELEAIMQALVTYGDIRRPPSASESAPAILTRVESALPRLRALADRIAALTDDALGAQAALIRYTQTVLEGVRQELQDARSGTPAQVEAHYAAALDLMHTIERRFKGLWGTVDLPIIHSFYAAAAHAVPSPE